MNPFEVYGDRQIPHPRKARLRAAEKRLLKVHEEKQELSKAYRKYRAEKHEKLVTGPYKAAAGELIGFLESMDLESGTDLIVLVERGPWRNADRDTQYEILNLVNRAIVKLRERNGLCPFDDALESDASLTVFQIIRGVLQQ
jgi:hypothetical protein